MSKQLSQTKIEKIKAREAKELVLRRKQSGVHLAKGYIIILMIVLMLAYVADEMTTNITGTLQSNIIFDFFKTQDPSSEAFTKGLSSFASLGMMLMPFYFILPFYKALADKFGRRPFLIINTAMMGVSMVIIMFAQSWTMFIVGYVILQFFIPNDIHSLYLMENAPAKHRVKFSLGAKAIAILAISSLGLLRMAFLVEGDVSSWRNVYIVPIIIALAVALVVIFLAKETPQFVKNRVDYLEKGYEERTKEEAINKEASKKTGVFVAMKFAFKHKQLRWLIISAVFFGFAAVCPGYYTSIMAQGGVSTEQVSYMIITYPFIYSATTFLGGFISDKFGRKVMTVLYAILSVTALTAFVLLSNVINSGVVLGIIYGVYIAGLWTATDAMYYVIPQESSPTHLRASCVAVIVLTSVVGGLVAMVLMTILVSLIPLQIAVVAFTAFAMIGSMSIFIPKVKETKDVDLTTVRGDEWDD